MMRLIYLILADIVRNKIVLAYTLFLAVFAWSIFSLEDSSNKGVLTLLNIMLLAVPLVSVLFSTIYIYNRSEFIELLLSQPIPRSRIWISLFAGLCISLVGAYILAAALPLLLFVNTDLALLLLGVGSVVTMVFVSIAFFAATTSRDKAKGIGIAVLLWLYFALLFDGLVLFLLFQFSEYPIEKMMVWLSASSPLDLARILVLLRLDNAALLGYTGAIFKASFGSDGGLVLAFVCLGLWVAVPFFISLKIFQHKDI